MSTEPKPAGSRRKLGILGVVAVAGALTLVVTGIRAREDSGTKLKEWTDDQAVPSVAVIYPSPSVLSATIDLPGFIRPTNRQGCRPPPSWQRSP